MLKVKPFNINFNKVAKKKLTAGCGVLFCSCDFLFVVLTGERGASFLRLATGCCAVGDLTGLFAAGDLGPSSPEDIDDRIDLTDIRLLCFTVLLGNKNIFYIVSLQAVIEVLPFMEDRPGLEN